MNISAYILEYLKQFGTVTVPSFGVFSLENSKAIINSENGSILPPASQIAFTPDFEIQSDDLIAFIAEQKQMSFAASKSDLKIQTDFWKKKLQAEQTLEIQNLGTVFIEEGHTHFKGKRIESGHPDFYGLEEIKFSDIKTKDKSVVSEKSGKEYKFSKSLLWIFLIVIPILGIVYLAFTNQELLFGKESFKKEKDSIKVNAKLSVLVRDTVKVDSTKMKMADSVKTLKKDSIVKPVVKAVQIPTTPNKTKATWQK
ncbi:HU domain-containing protein [Chryseobacterium polytrichastri]|uniref:CCDC81-like prokaryotic HU domain-containing protein n=1 Tax=Chryseobacterium polytrichastri TaxID=1302687 RepID=A0A1M6YGA8_9FLAO|nr:hypothetical protein [Chryseobacterium polytrichastri]SHL17075.1 hypothetical protein SAMN05444267_101330 [Chryseobacterium polytrichastri]